MILFHRSAGIAPGQLRAALAFAKEVAALIHAKTGVEVIVSQPVAGNPNRVGWTLRFDSLAHYDGTMERLRGDTEYGELLARNGTHFNAGSLHDELWRSF
jgi:hypothetical protein